MTSEPINVSASSPTLAEIILHDVPESTQLQSLLSVEFLMKRQDESSTQFKLWISEETTKQLNWQGVKVYRKMVVEKPKEIKQNQDDREEGELPDDEEPAQ